MAFQQLKVSPWSGCDMYKARWLVTAEGLAH